MQTSSSSSSSSSSFQNAACLEEHAENKSTRKQRHDDTIKTSSPFYSLSVTNFIQVFALFSFLFWGGVIRIEDSRV